jgi:hypothetical protein
MDDADSLVNLPGHAVRPVQAHRSLATTGADRRLREIPENGSRLFDAYARRSDVADATPDAVDSAPTPRSARYLVAVPVAFTPVRLRSVPF